MKSSGFTLIEVLIAMGILATLSILTAQSISRSIRGKQNIQNNIDVSSAFTSAIKIIERDIQMAFHFRDIHHEISMKLQTQKPQQNSPTNTSGNQAPVAPPSAANTQRSIRPAQVTLFKGTEEKLDFVTLLQGRGYGKGLEGDQKEVGYYLEQCRRFTKPSENSNCLWRRISSFVDDDIERGGTARVLLEDVKTLEFRFYDQQQKRWNSVWDSKTQNNFFPAAVEITIETENETVPFKFQTVIPIRYPNNQKLPNPQVPTQSYFKFHPAHTLLGAL